MRLSGLSSLRQLGPSFWDLMAFFQHEGLLLDVFKDTKAKPSKRADPTRLISLTGLFELVVFSTEEAQFREPAILPHVCLLYVCLLVFGVGRTKDTQRKPMGHMSQLPLL